MRPLQEIIIRENLCSLDYLIYSSHKTGTQTLNRTLNFNGIQSRHCHNLSHINLKEGDLSELAEYYYKQNGQSLKIISVFRDPVER